MSSIINPYRFVGEGPAPGGDYVTITVHATLTIEEDMFDPDYKYFVVDGSLSSAFTVTDAGSASGSETIEVYLIASGGGGGAATAGGGFPAGSGAGAGGYLRNTTYDNDSSLAQVYDVTIEAGGTGGLTGGTAPTNGGDSVLTPASGSALTAVGGGFGGYFNAAYNAGGGDGGSGGGAGYGGVSDVGYGTGTTDQGYRGGGGSPYSSFYNPFNGGGGAGAVGDDGGGGSGGGGVGVQYEWMDDNYNMLGPDGDGFFAGGGGGGGTYDYNPGGDGGSGGGGGGGFASVGTDGAANSGGGGGGGGNIYYSSVYNGGGGGSGYLIIRWKYQN